jgi:hypothetical protein
MPAVGTEARSSSGVTVLAVAAALPKFKTFQTTEAAQYVKDLLVA